MRVAVGTTRNGTRIVRVPLGENEEPETAITRALKKANRMDVYERWVGHGRLTEVIDDPKLDQKPR